MTFIPSVLSTMDVNNSCRGTVTTFIGSSTSTTGYNYIILTINASNSSVAGGIKIYMNNDGETPTVYYSDTYQQANTTYNRNFKIVKKNYYISFTASSSSSTTLNMSSRLTTSELEDTINNSVSTFNFSKEAFYDAFGKLRVSEPTTLIDIKIPGFNTGSSSFVTNNLALCNDSSGNYTESNTAGSLTITGTGAGHYISQSRKYTVYQPGKSLLILMSGILMPTNGGTYVPNFTGRIGYYTNDMNYNSDVTVPYNGLYYEYSSGVCYINLCNKGSITSFSQSNWNLDTMDGNGPSGLSLDFSKAQLFSIDLEWLGVGRVRFGFFAYGQVHYCHEIININGLTGPYISTANLPVRYELIGTNSGTAHIEQICATVISEGGYVPFGNTFSAVSPATSINLNVETPILAIQGGGSNYNHQNIIPLNTQIVNSANTNTCLWKLRVYLDANTSNAGVTSWTNVDQNYSVTQYSTSFSGFTTLNSIVLQQGIFSGKAVVSLNILSDVFNSQNTQITSNIKNVSAILLLTCTVLDGGSGATIYGTVDFGEIY